MSAYLIGRNGKQLLVGYIPGRFDGTFLTIEADHPLAPRVVPGMPPASDPAAPESPTADAVTVAAEGASGLTSDGATVTASGAAAVTLDPAPAVAPVAAATTSVQGEASTTVRRRSRT